MTNTYNISLHKGQLKIFHDKHKVRVACIARRYGKSRLMINELLLAALGFPGQADRSSPEKVIGALPTLTQARKILWQPLVNICEQTEISKYVKNISKTEFRISFEGRKPDIQIVGANDNDGSGMRGLRLWYAGLDEFQHYKKGIFDAVVVPAMSDTPGSRALLCGTPLGKNSYFYEIYQRATLYPDIYAAFHGFTWENPTIDPLEIEMARKTLPPKLFRQEMEASWEQNDQAIFTELDEDNRIAKLPDSFDQTLIGLDWGDTSPSITVWGRLEHTWYFIDAWNPSSGLVVPEPYLHAKLVDLAARWNPSAIFCDPSRPASILTVRTLGSKHGLLGLRKAVAGYNRIEDGLTQMHSLIFQNRLLIPKEDLTKGRKDHVSGDAFYNELASYCYATDKEGNPTDKVKDNQKDHNTDSSRYVIARKIATL